MAERSARKLNRYCEGGDGHLAGGGAMVNKSRRMSHGEANLTGFLKHTFLDRWNKKKRERMVFSHTLCVSRYTGDTFMLKNHENVHFTYVTLNVRFN